MREAGYGDKGRVEPTYYRSACNILKRHSDGPAAASTPHFSNVSMHNVDSSPIMTRSHHSRIPVNRLPQVCSQNMHSESVHRRELDSIERVTSDVREKGREKMIWCAPTIRMCVRVLRHVCARVCRDMCVCVCRYENVYMR
jgi:hypothetical protein